MPDKPSTVIQDAKEQKGAPYVYGTWGQPCTPKLRRKYAGYNPSKKTKIYGRCQVLRDKDPKPSCDGCPYEGMLAFDCRGFTNWLLKQAGITITGDYVGRQWSDSNWDVKGTDIKWLPESAVANLFVGDMSHTGMCLTNKDVMHCSGEVKEETLGKGRAWKKWAIAKGLYTWHQIFEMLKGAINQMLKKGMTGKDVMILQARLNELGYNCGTVDGKFGNKTEEQVKKFQRDNGLNDDGIVGEETLKKLGIQPDGPDEDGILVSRAKLEAIKTVLDQIDSQVTALAANINIILLD